MIEIDGRKYKLLKNYKDAFNIADLEDRITDYFYDFDYILGDYAYGKVRLKGFNNKDNKNFSSINDYEKIEEYINNCCAYDCKYFVLQSLNK